MMHYPLYEYIYMWSKIDLITTLTFRGAARGECLFFGRANIEWRSNEPLREGSGARSPGKILNF